MYTSRRASLVRGSSTVPAAVASGAGGFSLGLELALSTRTLRPVPGPADPTDPLDAAHDDDDSAARTSRRTSDTKSGEENHLISPVPPAGGHGGDSFRRRVSVLPTRRDPNQAAVDLAALAALAPVAHSLSLNVAAAAASSSSSSVSSSSVSGSGALSGTAYSPRNLDPASSTSEHLRSVRQYPNYLAHKPTLWSNGPVALAAAALAAQEAEREAEREALGLGDSAARRRSQRNSLILSSSSSVAELINTAASNEHDGSRSMSDTTRSRRKTGGDDEAFLGSHDDLVANDDHISPAAAPRRRSIDTGSAGTTARLENDLHSKPDAAHQTPTAELAKPETARPAPLAESTTPPAAIPSQSSPLASNSNTPDVASISPAPVSSVIVVDSVSADHEDDATTSAVVVPSSAQASLAASQRSSLSSDTLQLLSLPAAPTAQKRHAASSSSVSSSAATSANVSRVATAAGASSASSKRASTTSSSFSLASTGTASPAVPVASAATTRFFASGVSDEQLMREDAEYDALMRLPPSSARQQRVAARRHELEAMRAKKASQPPSTSSSKRRPRPRAEMIVGPSSAGGPSSDATNGFDTSPTFMTEAAYNTLHEERPPDQLFPFEREPFALMEGAYRFQGNKAMQRRAALAARQKLEKHPGVRERITEFWRIFEWTTPPPPPPPAKEDEKTRTEDAAQRTLKRSATSTVEDLLGDKSSSTAGSAAASAPVAAMTSITRSQYIAVHMLMTKALHEVWSLASAQKLAEQEWIKDIRAAAAAEARTGDASGGLLLSGANSTVSMKDLRLGLRKDASVKDLVSPPPEATSPLPPPPPPRRSDKPQTYTSRAAAAALAALHPAAADPVLTSSLSKGGLMRAVFEVVDLWTEGVEPEEYTRFLSLLLSRITKPNPAFVEDVPVLGGGKRHKRTRVAEGANPMLHHSRLIWRDLTEVQRYKRPIHLPPGGLYKVLLLQQWWRHWWQIRCSRMARRIQAAWRKWLPYVQRRRYTREKAARRLQRFMRRRWARARLLAAPIVPLTRKDPREAYDTAASSDGPTSEADTETDSEPEDPTTAAAANVPEADVAQEPAHLSMRELRAQLEHAHRVSEQMRDLRLLVWAVRKLQHFWRRVREAREASDAFAARLARNRAALLAGRSTMLARARKRLANRSRRASANLALLALLEFAQLPPDQPQLSAEELVKIAAAEVEEAHRVADLARAEVAALAQAKKDRLAAAAAAELAAETTKPFFPALARVGATPSPATDRSHYPTPSPRAGGGFGVNYSTFPTLLTSATVRELRAFLSLRRARHPLTPLTSASVVARFLYACLTRVSRKRAKVHAEIEVRLGALRRRQRRLEKEEASKGLTKLMNSFAEEQDGGAATATAPDANKKQAHAPVPSAPDTPVETRATPTPTPLKPHLRIAIDDEAHPPILPSSSPTGGVTPTGFGSHSVRLALPDATHSPVLTLAAAASQIASLESHPLASIDALRTSIFHRALHDLWPRLPLLVRACLEAWPFERVPWPRTTPRRARAANKNRRGGGGGVTTDEGASSTGAGEGESEGDRQHAEDLFLFGSTSGAAVARTPDGRHHSQTQAFAHAKARELTQRRRQTAGEAEAESLALALANALTPGRHHKKKSKKKSSHHVRHHSRALSNASTSDGDPMTGREETPEETDEDGGTRGKRRSHKKSRAKSKAKSRPRTHTRSRAATRTGEDATNGDFDADAAGETEDTVAAHFGKQTSSERQALRRERRARRAAKEDRHEARRLARGQLVAQGLTDAEARARLASSDSSSTESSGPSSRGSNNWGADDGAQDDEQFLSSDSELDRLLTVGNEAFANEATGGHSETINGRDDDFDEVEVEEDASPDDPQAVRNEQGRFVRHVLVRTRKYAARANEIIRVAGEGAAAIMAAAAAAAADKHQQGDSPTRRVVTGDHPDDAKTRLSAYIAKLKAKQDADAHAPQHASSPRAAASSNGATPKSTMTRAASVRRPSITKQTSTLRVKKVSPAHGVSGANSGPRTIPEASASASAGADGGDDDGLEDDEDAASARLFQDDVDVWVGDGGLNGGLNAEALQMLDMAQVAGKLFRNHRAGRFSMADANRAEAERRANKKRQEGASEEAKNGEQPLQSASIEEEQISTLQRSMRANPAVNLSPSNASKHHADDGSPPPASVHVALDQPSPKSRSLVGVSSSKSLHASPPSDRDVDESAAVAHRRRLRALAAMAASVRDITPEEARARKRERYARAEARRAERHLTLIHPDAAMDGAQRAARKDYDSSSGRRMGAVNSEEKHAAHQHHPAAAGAMSDASGPHRSHRSSTTVLHDLATLSEPGSDGHATDESTLLLRSLRQHVGVDGVGSDSDHKRASLPTHPGPPGALSLGVASLGSLMTINHSASHTRLVLPFDHALAATQRAAMAQPPVVKAKKHTRTPHSSSDKQDTEVVAADEAAGEGERGGGPAVEHADVGSIRETRRNSAKVVGEGRRSSSKSLSPVIHSADGLAWPAHAVMLKQSQSHHATASSVGPPPIPHELTVSRSLHVTSDESVPAEVVTEEVVIQPAPRKLVPQTPRKLLDLLQVRTVQAHKPSPHGPHATPTTTISHEALASTKQTAAEQSSTLAHIPHAASSASLSEASSMPASRSLLPESPAASAAPPATANGQPTLIPTKPDLPSPVRPLHHARKRIEHQATHDPTLTKDHASVTMPPEAASSSSIEPTASSEPNAAALTSAPEAPPTLTDAATAVTVTESGIDASAELVTSGFNSPQRPPSPPEEKQPSDEPPTATEEPTDAAQGLPPALPPLLFTKVRKSSLSASVHARRVSQTARVLSSLSAETSERIRSQRARAQDDLQAIHARHQQREAERYAARAARSRQLDLWSPPTHRTGTSPPRALHRQSMGHLHLPPVAESARPQLAASASAPLMPHFVRDPTTGRLFRLVPADADDVDTLDADENQAGGDDAETTDINGGTITTTTTALRLPSITSPRLDDGSLSVHAISPPRVRRRLQSTPRRVNFGAGTSAAASAADWGSLSITNGMLGASTAVTDSESTDLALVSLPSSPPVAAASEFVSSPRRSAADTTAAMLPTFTSPHDRRSYVVAIEPAALARLTLERVMMPAARQGRIHRGNSRRKAEQPARGVSPISSSATRRRSNKWTSHAITTARTHAAVLRTAQAIHEQARVTVSGRVADDDLMIGTVHTPGMRAIGGTTVDGAGGLRPVHGPSSPSLVASSSLTSEHLPPSHSATDLIVSSLRSVEASAASSPRHAPANLAGVRRGLTVPSLSPLHQDAPYSESPVAAITAVPAPMHAREDAERAAATEVHV